MMGGFSRWNVLGDGVISKHLPEYFSEVPEVVSGLLTREAEKVWTEWNPAIWEIISARGCFEKADA
jgi:hypothetical protein